MRKLAIVLLPLLLLALVMGAVGCDLEEEPTPTPSPMTLYESTEHGFSIKYPEGWTESAGGGRGAFPSRVERA